MIDALVMIADFLRANGFQNVFVDSIPDKPDDVVTLYEYETVPYKRFIDMGVIHRRLQVRSRKKTRDEAYAEITKLYELLNTKLDTTPLQIGGVDFIFQPLTAPVKLDVDSQDRVVFSFNLHLILQS